MKYLTDESTTKENTMQTQQMAIHKKSAGFINIDNDSYDHLLMVAKGLSKSPLISQEDRKDPECIVAKWIFGHEIGLAPMQSLRSIYLINGKPAIYGDAMLALCRRHPDFVDIHEEISPDGTIARCTVKRRGEEDTVRTFSMEDAAKAGLSRKPGPWTQYPTRMLQMRARSFAIRDSFSDMMSGILTKEEADDIPVIQKNNSRPPVEYDAEIAEFTESLSDKELDYLNKLLNRLNELGLTDEDVLNLCKKTSAEDYSRADMNYMLQVGNMIKDKKTTADELKKSNPVVHDLINDILKANYAVS